MYAAPDAVLHRQINWTQVTRIGTFITDFAYNWALGVKY